MNKEQLVYVLKENESLKIKLQRINQSTERLQTRYYDTETQLTNVKRKYDFLYSQFKEIGRQCFPRDYIEKEMSSASEKELFDFLITKIREIEAGVYDLEVENKKSLDEIKEKDAELERLKKAPMQFQSTPQTIDENGVEVQGDNIIDRPKNIPYEENPTLAVLSNMEENEWNVLEIIGTGKTLFTDIALKLGVSNTATKDVLESLKSKSLINSEKVMKGGKGRPALHYFLTPLGVDIYKKRYENDPETTKLEELSTHGSPAHGGLMVETGKFYEDNGCTVYYDGPETTYKLNNGKEIRFDLKVIDPNQKEPILVETERGKCGEQHLSDKFSKCLEFTKLMYTKSVQIIAPNKETLGYLQQQLFKWVRKQDNIQMLGQKDLKSNAAIIFRTATLEDLKSGKFQEFYYGYK